MDGGAKHARDSGNPHAPGRQAGILATSPRFYGLEGGGKGSFIISDINNSVNGVAIRHLQISHSAQQQSLRWAGFTPQLYSQCSKGCQNRPGTSTIVFWRSPCPAQREARFMLSPGSSISRHSPDPPGPGLMMTSLILDGGNGSHQIHTFSFPTTRPQT